MTTFYTFNTSILKPDQPDDIYLLTDYENVFRFNLNAGLYYYNSTVFIGLSAAKIFQDVTAVYDAIKMQPKIFLTSGYRFKLKKTSYLEPCLTVYNFDNKKTIADLFTKLHFNRFYWIALAFSTSGKINFLCTIHLKKTLYFGYNYEYTISKIASYTSGSFEIYFGINLGLLRLKG